MSATALLFIIVIAASLVAFADSAIQWTLRVVLDGGFDDSRARKRR